jgi:two-component system CheB/CheR fusion protein
MEMATESRGCVLHVEDDAAVRNAIAMLLRSDGFKCLSAASGARALELLAQGAPRPDVLIVDFHLDEDMNGAEAAEEINRALGCALPTIVLTADPANAEMPWTTQAPVWLARKPMAPGALLAAMPALVQLSRALRAVMPANPAKPVPLTTTRNP